MQVISKIFRISYVLVLVMAVTFLLSSCALFQQEESELPLQKATAVQTTEKQKKEMHVVAADTKKEQQDKICVYVCGAVQSQGVYTLNADARIVDAVEAAGGFSGKAAQDYLNQAQRIKDGDRIYIPTRKEVKKQEQQQTVDAGQEQEKQGDAYNRDGKINLNTASEQELLTLSGIGEAKAQAIVAYRQEHGSFQTIEEIMNIEGIKDGVFKKIKDNITVG